MNYAGWFLLAAAVCETESRALQADFGATMQLTGSSPCSVRGDFNGDGVTDTAWVVRTTGALKAGVRTENPWKLSKTAAPGGIAVVLSGTPKQLYFLSDGDYFSSPIWAHPESLLSAQRQGKGHLLLVATESGEDMRLSFDGKVWRVRP